MPAKLTQEGFITKAKEIHGCRYDYSEAKYINIYEPIVIKCDIHGQFRQMPTKHLSGHGCLHCANLSRANKRRLKFDNFVERANVIHNYRYEYPQVLIESANKKVPIVCHIHGEFFQSPNNHLSGNGCPRCNFRKSPLKTLKAINNKRGEYEDIPFNFYVIRFYNDEESFLKVGVSSNTNSRYKKKIGYKLEVLLDYPTNLYEARKLENFVLNELSVNRYNPLKKFSGYTECVASGLEYNILLKIKEFIIGENRSDLVGEILDFEYGKG